MNLTDKEIMRLDGEVLRFDCETTLLEAYQCKPDIEGIKAVILVYTNEDIWAITIDEDEQVPTIVQSRNQQCRIEQCTEADMDVETKNRLLMAGWEVARKVGAEMFGMTKLTIAAMLGQMDAAQALIDNGADVNETDKHGMTALMYAALAGKTEAVKALLAAGADPESRDSGGMTALLKAAGRSKAEFTRALLKADANLEATDEGGMTALMLAKKYGHADMVKLLEAAARERAAKPDAERD